MNISIPLEILPILDSIPVEDFRINVKTNAKIIKIAGINSHIKNVVIFFRNLNIITPKIYAIISAIIAPREKVIRRLNIKNISSVNIKYLCKYFLTSKILKNNIGMAIINKTAK
jgi:hypothetical protein